jgi:two-component system phosphate regulon response regulator PhoB
MNQRLLVVEDEGPMRRMIEEILKNEGFLVRTAANAEDALVELRKGVPDLAVLDVRMPGMSGFDLCRKMRETAEWRAIPVIFLTSKEDQGSKVAGLELGGDDYVTKPFGAPELAARVKAVLRRIPGRAPDLPVKGGAVHIDPVRRRVTVKGKEITLTAREFDLLKLLLEKKGATLTRGYLLEALWGRDGGESTRSIDQHVYRLRKALGKHAACVECLEGVGYRWKNL